jgi:hypothetical protein
MINRPVCCIAGAIVAIAACAAPQNSSAKKGSPGMGSSDATSPWQLHLEQVGALGLRLTLRNISASPQTYLYDSRLQPAELHLIDASGKEIAGADKREVMKYDTTVYRSRYKIMKPGEEVVVCEAAFHRSNGHYELNWGVFEFNGLAPSSYLVKAVWKSDQSQWKERDSNKSGVIPGIWLGTVGSNVVEIELK